MKNRKARKDGNYILNVCFSANDVDLLKHADMQGSFSAYVKRLIRADMKQESNNNININQLLSNGDILKLLNVNTVEQQPPQQDIKEEVDVDAINCLLDMD